MSPYVEELADIFSNVRFAKYNLSNDHLDNNLHNIRSLPTFRFFHRGSVINEVTGAQRDKLKQILVLL